MLKEITKVARELPPVGGQGPVPFAPFTGNMVPLVMLHRIATAKDPKRESELDLDVRACSIGVKGKRKGAPTSPLLLNLKLSRPSLTLLPLCPLHG